MAAAELRQLRARERMPRLRPTTTAYDGSEHVPTFDEIVAVARQESARLGRRIGVYPKVKYPAYFRRIALRRATAGHRVLGQAPGLGGSS